ncbi:hypothetical protein QBC35DRAFT_462006 [Podospora australis]|uniref:DUF7730 domain-containing protein n=1 Tax=Podospora australis TaxID=1536484 RepID=A0AAN6WY84_9PEZI|nr:hypothetical protein QBC35DRAFT_462006 [Podospora australis]
MICTMSPKHDDELPRLHDDKTDGGSQIIPEVTQPVASHNINNDSPLRLDTLPCEILLQIYGYLLVKTKPLSLDFDYRSRCRGYRQPRGPLHLHPAILRVCRRFYREAIQSLYRENIFYFRRPDTLTSFIKQIGPDNSHDLRRIVLGVQDEFEDEVATPAIIGAPPRTAWSYSDQQKFQRNCRLWEKAIDVLVQQATGLQQVTARCGGVYGLHYQKLRAVWGDDMVGIRSHFALFGHYYRLRRDSTTLNALGKFRGTRLKEFVLDGFFSQKWLDHLSHEVGCPVRGVVGYCDMYEDRKEHALPENRRKGGVALWTDERIMRLLEEERKTELFLHFQDRSSTEDEI